MQPGERSQEPPEQEGTDAHHQEGDGKIEGRAQRCSRQSEARINGLCEQQQRQHADGGRECEQRLQERGLPGQRRRRTAPEGGVCGTTGQQRERDRYTYTHQLQQRLRIGEPVEGTCQGGERVIHGGPLLSIEVRYELALEQQDLVLERQLALLEALELQFVDVEIQ